MMTSLHNISNERMVLPKCLLLFLKLKQVFQRRQDGSENFDRDFMDYSQGFGNKDGEFWLGNDALRNMTANGNYELRIDMWDWENSYKYATYEGFAVTGEDYQLSFTEGSYDGTAG